jgi:hypothetical protein
VKRAIRTLAHDNLEPSPAELSLQAAIRIFVVAKPQLLCTASSMKEHCCPATLWYCIVPAEGG